MALLSTTNRVLSITVTLLTLHSVITWYGSGRKETAAMEPKTLTVPDAGRIYFDLGRNASYEAARRGDIPTIRIGKLLRVPVGAMERKLEETGR
jgi:hypothetical protein